ncbi:hypothetical protein C0Q44_23750 [Paenibacillus sp. PCH8]|uniref:DUF4309 domain-containing protein n=1 Tax=Paenibacillus sp. PCH8 TaxID=2066524 RepID=UPI000CF8DDE8|nr:DUF4309 domain-containing protein [Paenibacillus sp. PCH8]PQP81411.1 hypothetical protein C0Q44_23750 [Paenibacillus sp. PCH8]
MIHPKHNAKWASLALLTLIGYVLSVFLLLPANVAAKGEQISAKQLESMSRLSFTLRDAKQTAYNVYIFAYDEQKSTLSEPNDWTNNKKGDKSHSGTYRAALLKKGAAYGTVQAAKLDLSTIILPQTWNFVVKSKEAGTPDMLMITEKQTSNYNEAKTFIVRSGELHRVMYVDNNGKKIDDSYSAIVNDGIRTLSGSRVQFKNFNNVYSVYEFSTFKLNVNKAQMRMEDTRNLRSKTWPNSGGGDRAYLKSLKESASKGLLPGRTDIKIGMTLQSVQKKLGKPQSRSNEEGTAYYYYSKYGIGFDSYMHELNNKSRIAAIQLYNEQQYLSPWNVKIWMGKPSSEYYNELIGGYEMVYKLGKHSIVFNYEEDDDLIDFTNIY